MHAQHSEFWTMTEAFFPVLVNPANAKEKKPSLAGKWLLCNYCLIFHFNNLLLLFAHVYIHGSTSQRHDTCI